MNFCLFQGFVNHEIDSKIALISILIALLGMDGFILIG